jgi:hypothetical protein
VSGQKTRHFERAPFFTAAFGTPAGHALRLVRLAQGTGARVGLWQWEHEEHDEDGNLVAVYESWFSESVGLDFVKYSPYGWVLNISGRSPRLPPVRAKARPVVAA